MDAASHLDQALQAIHDLLATGNLPNSLPDELKNHPVFQQLIADLDSLHEFALALSKGELHQPLQMKGRGAGALKLLQANFRHLAWQTKRIAAGDFDQRVEFMGDIADAFNHMAGSLADARAELGIYEARLSQAHDRLQHEISQRKDIGYLNAGDLTGLERTARRQLELAQSGNRLMSEVWARMMLGWVHYERNDLSEADRHYSAGAEYRDGSNARAAYECLIGLSLTKNALGEQDHALATLRSAQVFSSEISLAGSENELKSLRMRLDLLHDPVSGSNLKPESIEIETGQTQLTYIEDPALTRAQIHIAYGTLEHANAALDILQGVQDAAEAGLNSRRLVPVFALKAMAMDVLSQPDAALDLLEQAVNLGRQGGFIRTFVDLGPKTESPLTRLSERMGTSGYLAEILSSCRQPVVEMVMVCGEAAPALSERELEVLRLLAANMLGKRIATTLDISPLTVRTHKHNIYKKLGVHTRRQAVERATKCGILSE
jgi:ATP/maltotriose-dependent transcriptional regulator MalT